jgi:enoyl-CoA hydratase
VLGRGRRGDAHAQPPRPPQRPERLVSALVDHPHPTLAAINGPAVAGGFAIALLCDLRVAAPAATFGFPALVRGIPAAYAAARAALPPAVARDLALTGRTIDAREALALGVVSAVGALPDVALERAGWIAAHPPRGVDMVTDWIRRDRGDWRALLALEAEMFRRAL